MARVGSGKVFAGQDGVWDLTSTATPNSSGAVVCRRIVRRAYAIPDIRAARRGCGSWHIAERSTPPSAPAAHQVSRDRAAGTLVKVPGPCS